MQKKSLNRKIIDSYSSALCGSNIDNICKFQDNIMMYAVRAKSFWIEAIFTMLAIIVPLTLCFWVALVVEPIKVILTLVEPTFWINLLLEITDIIEEDDTPKTITIKQASAEDI